MFTDRQKQIVDEAVKIISEKGIGELTIRNLADKVGITEGAIYRHFKSKTEIIKSILLFFQEDSKRLVEEIRDKKIPPFGKISLFFLEHFKKLSNNPAYITAIFSEDIFVGEEFSRLVGEIIKVNKAALIDFIKEAKKNKSIRKDIPTEHIAILIMGSLRLTVKEWKNNKTKFDLEKRGTGVLYSIIKLIKK